MFNRKEHIKYGTLKKDHKKPSTTITLNKLDLFLIKWFKDPSVGHKGSNTATQLNKLDRFLIKFFKDPN